MKIQSLRDTSTLRLFQVEPINWLLLINDEFKKIFVAKSNQDNLFIYENIKAFATEALLDIHQYNYHEILRSTLQELSGTNHWFVTKLSNLEKSNLTRSFTRLMNDLILYTLLEIDRLIQAIYKTE